MIVGISEDATEIEVRGLRAELQELAANLLRGAGIIHCDTTNRETAYPRKGKNIEIRKVAAGHIKVQLQPDEVLQIQGSMEALKILADNVRNFALEPLAPTNEGRVAQHMHIEYYEGHFFLTPDSIPLIFCHAEYLLDTKK